MQEWAIKNKGTGVTIHLYVHSFMCICIYVSGQLSWVAFINQKNQKYKTLSSHCQWRFFSEKNSRSFIVPISRYHFLPLT